MTYQQKTLGKYRDASDGHCNLSLHVWWETSARIIIATAGSTLMKSLRNLRMIIQGRDGI